MGQLLGWWASPQRLWQRESSKYEHSWYSLLSYPPGRMLLPPPCSCVSQESTHEGARALAGLVSLLGHMWTHSASLWSVGSLLSAPGQPAFSPSRDSFAFGREWTCFLQLEGHTWRGGLGRCPWMSGPNSRSFSASLYSGPLSCLVGPFFEFLWGSRHILFWSHLILQVPGPHFCSPTTVTTHHVLIISSKIWLYFSSCPYNFKFFSFISFYCI